MDNLTYKYENSNNSNQILTVSDAGSQTSGFTELTTQSTTEYSYDGNGNLSFDYNKSISEIDYNYLNLPDTIVFSNGNNILYRFDAAGKKLQNIDPTGKIIDYIGPFVYEDGVLTYMLTSEGRVLINGSTYSYEYFLKDHLGNTRLVFRDADKNGVLATSEIDQVSDYYPFGLRQEPIQDLGSTNKYLYNGKELQNGTEWLDYGARMYDPALGRWQVQDPRSEDFYSINPYSYAANNPILVIDPAGDTIVISYQDADGNTQTHTFNSNYKVQDGDAQFIKDFYAAYNYLSENGAAGVIDELAETSKFISVKETQEKRGKGFENTKEAWDQSIYQPFDYLDENNTINIGTISWNPRAALKVHNNSEGTEGFQSPALGLLHEFGHGAECLDSPSSYTFNAKLRFGAESYIYNGERIVIQNVETPVAVKLSKNDYPEATRDNYGGRPYISTGPTSIIKK